MLGEPRTAACETGVSRQTVSRVIDNIDGISHQTLENVQTAFARLGYKSGGFATQDFLSIDLVVPDVANPLFADVSTLTRRSIIRPPAKVVMGPGCND